MNVSKVNLNFCSNQHAANLVGMMHIIMPINRTSALYILGQCNTENNFPNCYNLFSDSVFSRFFLHSRQNALSMKLQISVLDFYSHAIVF